MPVRFIGRMFSNVAQDYVKVSPGCSSYTEWSMAATARESRTDRAEWKQGAV